MKKVFRCAGFIILHLSFILSFAQVPQAFNYQAVVRDALGVPVTNTAVDFRFLIRDGSPGGAVVFTETDTVTTNPFGLATIQIGGNSSLSGVTWSSANKYLMVEIDVDGSGYTEMGTTQLLSVPYALYADNAGAAGPQNAWSLTGNTGTTFGANYIGTNDYVDLMFKVGGNSAGFLESVNNNQSTAFGIQALNNETPHNQNGNAAFGYQALSTNTAGSSNTAIGYQSLYSNYTGGGNTGIGYFSLLSNGTGSYNTATGQSALYANTNGSYNTANGYSALFYDTSGKGNTAVGASALINNNSGSYNTCDGYFALYSNRTGSYNTALGYGADVKLGNLTNATAIGANAYVAQSNTLVLGSINGVLGATATVSVGIGTNAPSYMLEVDGSAAKPGGGSWTATSDERLKQQVNPYKDGLDKLLKIEPVTYHYNQASGYDTLLEYVGVIAQQLKEVAPYMVGTFQKNGTQYYNVNNSAITYMLVNSIKEQQGIIENQQKQLDDLKIEITQLKAGDLSLKTEKPDVAKLNQLELQIGLLKQLMVQNGIQSQKQ